MNTQPRTGIYIKKNAAQPDESLTGDVSLHDITRKNDETRGVTNKLTNQTGKNNAAKPNQNPFRLAAQANPASAA